MNWVVLLHAFAFLLFWSTNRSFYASVNDFLADALGAPLPYIALFMALSVLLGLWTGWRMVRHRPRSWLHRSLSLLYLVFFYGSFALLFARAPAQLARLGYLVGYFRILLDVILLLALARWLPTRLPRVVAWLLLLAAWTIPILFPPGNVWRGALPARPLLMAHRGASMLAPENTLAAMRLAAPPDVHGLETDLLISRDCVPFLMHDSTLARTTDVARVFPGRESEPASNFTRAELDRLLAGEWFVTQDPYGTIASGLVTAGQAASYRAEGIPSLSDLTALLHQTGQALIFDLRLPPEGHPCRQMAFELVLSQLAADGVGAQTWLLVAPGEIARARALLPDALLTAGVNPRNPPTPEALLSAGYAIVNAEYHLPPRVIRAYRQAGLRVNLWTVDEVWLYLRLWLLGVDSVTTNSSHVFRALERPLFGLTFQTYLWIWLVVGALAAWLLARRMAGAR